MAPIRGSADTNGAGKAAEAAKESALSTLRRSTIIPRRRVAGVAPSKALATPARGCSPEQQFYNQRKAFEESFSAHVRCCEHGAPIQTQLITVSLELELTHHLINACLVGALRDTKAKGANGVEIGRGGACKIDAVEHIRAFDPQG